MVSQPTRPNEASAQVSISKLVTRMITVLNKYIYQFTNKGSIKQIAIVVIETRQIALVFPSIAGRNLHYDKARIPVEFGTTCVNLMEAQGGKGSSSSNRKERRRRFRAGARAPRFKK